MDEQETPVSFVFEDKKSNEFKTLSCCGYDASCTDCLLENDEYITARKNYCAHSLSKQNFVHDNCSTRFCAIAYEHPEVYKMFCDIASYELIRSIQKHKALPNS